MKKQIEYCDRCGSLQPHRYKKKSWKRTGKDKTKDTYMLPIKCMTCGYTKGKVRTEPEKKKKHIKI